MINSDFNFQIKVDEPKGDFEVERESSNILLEDYDRHIVYPDMKTLSAVEILELNKLCLNENIPVIVGVDVFYLPYDTNYKNGNSTHTVILCGHREDNSNAYIIDCGERVQYKGELFFDEYFEARSSLNSKGNNIYSGHPIDKFEAYIRRNSFPSCIDYSYLINKALNNALSYYNGNNYTGINALEQLKALLGNRASEETAFTADFFVDLYYQLYSINRKRKLFGLSIKKAEEIFKIEYTDKLYVQLSEVILTWERILSLLLKSRFMKNKRDVTQKIVDYIGAVIEQEREMYGYLYKAEVITR